MINISELRSMVNATQFESFANSVINSLLDRLEAAEKERDALRAKVEAIDAAVEMIELQERIFDVIERTWYKQGLDIRGASLSYFMTDVHSALEESK